MRYIYATAIIALIGWLLTTVYYDVKEDIRELRTEVKEIDKNLDNLKLDVNSLQLDKGGNK